MGSSRRTGQQPSQRPLSDQELINAARDAGETLSALLVPEALPTTAGVRITATQARLLLGKNRGDKLIDRIVRRFGLSPPTVTLAHAPRLGFVPGFEVANIPVRTDTAAVGQVDVPLPSWLNSSAVRTSMGGRTLTTWNMLVDDLAVQFGAHTATSVPGYVDRLAFFDVGRRGLVSHLVVTIGAVSLHAVRDIFQNLGIDGDLADLDYVQPSQIEITELIANNRAEDGNPVPWQFGIKNLSDEERVLISMPGGNNQMQVSARRNAQTGAIDNHLDWSRPIETRPVGLR